MHIRNVCTLVVQSWYCPFLISWEYLCSAMPSMSLACISLFESSFPREESWTILSEAPPWTFLLMITLHTTVWYANTMRVVFSGVIFLKYTTPFYSPFPRAVSLLTKTNRQLSAIISVGLRDKAPGEKQCANKK